MFYRRKFNKFELTFDFLYYILFAIFYFIKLRTFCSFDKIVFVCLPAFKILVFWSEEQDDGSVVKGTVHKDVDPVHDAIVLSGLEFICN